MLSENTELEAHPETKQIPQNLTNQSRIRENIELSPTVQKYMASCYPLADRPFINEAEQWKTHLQDLQLEPKTIELPLLKIARAFPHLGKLKLKGFFDRRSIQSYFEGTDPDSHNMRMYLLAKRMARDGAPPEVMDSILEHIETCSVKVAQISGKSDDKTFGRVWSYGGTYHAELDTQSLNPTIRSPEVFIHGRSDRGLMVIRDAGPAFEPLKEWYIERQQNGGGKLFKNYRPK